MSAAFPRLFLIGAPKCGTTSLAAWLGAHDRIAMSIPKEPNYYAPDVASSPAAGTEAAYLALFGPRAPGQLRAEASTTYLRSRVAVPRILADSPSARFVVTLRNPIDMAPSVHAQLVRSGREPVTDFARAWAMQARRRAAPPPRRAHHNPADWQYAEICRLGAQLEALYATVPRTRIHIVFLDDMAADPGSVYRRVLAFAGLPYDMRCRFPIHNERRVPRVPALARASHLAGGLRERLGFDRGTGLGARVNRLNERRPGAESRLAPDLRRILANTFRDDIRRLARLTGRDLDHWLTGEPPR